ncbi:hypothetical protein XELAEV_18033498mg [Xenopus laevis]|uniref:Uncharacterized protein n=1 Tax=Xenopus laevis TaxID=8355 RepID=A0A974CK26_XENLA|nr:hypothetical protein XELAEV_18033498mg [Xenopus laevis]
MPLHFDTLNWILQLRSQAKLQKPTPPCNKSPPPPIRDRCKNCKYPGDLSPAPSLPSPSGAATKTQA